jgi:hypothetical protein
MRIAPPQHSLPTRAAPAAPPQPMKAAAKRLAGLFATAEGAEILRLITRIARGAPEGRRVPAPGRSEPDPVRVGIWHSQTIKGERYFVRAASGHESSLWSNVGRIPPKRGRRVLLLGESVARGYFYDPHVTPASVLRVMLRALAPADEIDVVDLARTDLRLAALLDLARSAIVLEPDVMIVFAGNNWHPTSSFSAEEGETLELLLRNGSSPAVVREWVERTLTDHVHAAVQDLGALGRRHGVPVVFVLPEFNLVDWRDEGNATAAENDAAAAAPRAEARAQLESARDAGLFRAQMQTPRCYSVIQRSVRAAAPVHGVALVDLSAVFERVMQGSLPDRTLFLDYCHLTAAGIRHAMAATASVVAPLLGRHSDPETLRRVDVPVATKIDAEAHFLAAVHNANWGQNAEIVRYHCEQAVAIEPAVTRMMTLFLDFHIRRARAILCKSFEGLFELQNMSAVTLLAGANHSEASEAKLLNPVLIDEVVRVASVRQPDLRATTQLLLTREHGVAATGTDLLDPRYALWSYEQLTSYGRRAFYRATAGVSRFKVVCGHDGPVRFLLTARAPEPAAGRPFAVLVNDVMHFTERLTTRWTTHELVVPAGGLRFGFNVVEIRWPVLIDETAAPRPTCAPASGGGTDLAFVHGDIHRFEAFSISGHL